MTKIMDANIFKPCLFEYRPPKSFPNSLKALQRHGQEKIEKTREGLSFLELAKALQLFPIREDALFSFALSCGRLCPNTLHQIKLIPLSAQGFPLPCPCEQREI